MIIALCGPPGCGKSTIAQKLMNRLEDAHLISSEWFKRRVYERLFEKVGRMLGRQRYLVLDATFYRNQYRNRLREIASGRDRVLIVFLDCPLEISLKRNKERPNPIPEEAVRIMFSIFERPEDPDVQINTYETGAEEVVEIILETIRKVESDVLNKNRSHK